MLAGSQRSLYLTQTHTEKRELKKWKQCGEILGYVTQAEISGGGRKKKRKKRNQCVKLLGGPKRIVTGANMRDYG